MSEREEIKKREVKFQIAKFKAQNEDFSGAMRRERMRPGRRINGLRAQ
jgi:hypothetical protein